MSSSVPFSETPGESPRAVGFGIQVGDLNPPPPLFSLTPVIQAGRAAGQGGEGISVLMLSQLCLLFGSRPPAQAPPPRGHLCLLVRDFWQTIVVPCKSLFPRVRSSSADSSCPCRNSAYLLLMAHLSFLTAAKSGCPVQDRKDCSFGPNPCAQGMGQP